MSCDLGPVTCDLCFVPVLPSVHAHTFDVLICSNILLICSNFIQLQQLYFYCSNSLICIMSLVGHEFLGLVGYEFQSTFHSKNRYRTHGFVIHAISVFRVKCTEEFTSQAMNFSVEESKENDLIIKVATGNIRTRTIRNLLFSLTLQAVRINNQGAPLLGLAKPIY